MKIGNTWYNKDGISRMSFEEFCSIHASYSKEKQRNIYEQVTGKKAEEEKPKKEPKKKKGQDESIADEMAFDDKG